MADGLTKQDLIELKQELVTLLDDRFVEQQTWVKAELATQFVEQQTWVKAWVKAELATQFADERKYYTQFVKDELAELRQQLERIEEQIGGDATGALIEIDDVKDRLTKLEAVVAQLQAA